MPDPIQIHTKAVLYPWDTPFETLVWVSEHTGETLAIRRNEDLKILCGYVLLDLADPLVSKIKGKDIEGDFYVHGGVTWNAPIAFFPGKHAVGFDCAHYMDYIPYTGRGSPEDYKDEHYVRKECEKLGLQIKNARAALAGRTLTSGDSGDSDPGIPDLG